MELDTKIVQTKVGVIDCYCFAPSQTEKFPAVIFYMDGLGIRPELKSMAERLSSFGYFVLLPNLYYRHGDIAPLNVAEAFGDGPESERMMNLVGSLTKGMIVEDTQHLINALKGTDQVRTGGIACIGYCMGGGFALSTAGNYASDVRGAASIHGAFLATDQPDSPHLLANKITAKTYVGIAGIDPWFTDEEAQLLTTTLEKAGVDCEIETYQDAAHGFAVSDTPAYNEAASERHWSKMKAFLHDAFGA